MRQGLLAGLIVVAFGLPLGIVADRHEFVREFDALRAAAGGNMGPFRGIWMQPVETPTSVAEKDGKLGQIQRWGAWQLTRARNSSKMVRTVDAPSDFMIDLQLLAGSATANTEMEFSAPRFASLGATTSVIVAAVNGNDVPVYAMADSERAHSRLAALVDQFSIAAHAEEANVRRAPQSPATSDVANSTVARATDGDPEGSAIVPVPDPIAIVAEAGREAANSSGFVDIAQTPSPAETVGAISIPASVPGLVEVGSISN